MLGEYERRKLPVLKTQDKLISSVVIVSTVLELPLSISQFFVQTASFLQSCVKILEVALCISTVEISYNINS